MTTGHLKTRFFAICWLGAAFAWLLSMPALAVPFPGPHGEPDIPTIHWKERAFSIPYRMSGDAANRQQVEEVRLMVSTDQGKSWQVAASAAPSVTSFGYHAEQDGEFWFAASTVLRGDSETKPPTKADLRVIVDTSEPNLQLELSRRENGEVVAKWSAEDANLRPETLKLSARAPEQEHFQPLLIAPPAPDEQTERRGKVAWWPGRSSGDVAVRGEALDRAGNTRQVEVLLPTGQRLASSAAPASVPSSEAAPTQQIASASELPGFSESGQPTTNPSKSSSAAGGGWVAARPSLKPSPRREPDPPTRVDEPSPSHEPQVQPSSLVDTHLGPPPLAPELVAQARRVQDQAWSANRADGMQFGQLESNPWGDRGEQLPTPRMVATNDRTSVTGADLDAQRHRAFRSGVGTIPFRRQDSPFQYSSQRENPFPTPAESDRSADFEVSQGETRQPVGSPQNTFVEAEEIPLGEPAHRDSTSFGSNSYAAPGRSASQPSTVGGQTRTPAQFTNLEGQETRLVNSLTFALEYDVEAVGPWGVADVELWGTRDGGVHWRLYTRDEDRRSPLMVTVEGEGAYGFQVIVRSAGGGAVAPPRSGDTPDMNIMVDLVRPTLELESVEQGTGNLADHILLRWAAEDANLASRPITIYYAGHPSGPWSIAASGLENTGYYAWRLERHVPSELYIKLEARDAAGNTASYRTAQPFLPERPRPTGRIRGVRPVE